MKFIESNNPLAISLDDDSSADDTDTDFVSNSQIDAMEYTYICCHQYLANILNDQVYLKKNTFCKYIVIKLNLYVYEFD